MDENETVVKPIPPTSPAPSSSSMVPVYVLLALAIVIAAGFALRKELLTQMGTGFAQQQETVRQLAQRVSALEAQTATLAAQPHPDTAVIDGMHTDLGNAQATLAQLNDRIAVLEKKPVEAKAVANGAAATPTLTLPPQGGGNSAATDSPLVGFIKSGAPYQTELAAWVKAHPAMGPQVDALRANAVTGLPMDEALRAQLTAILNRLNAPAAPVTDDSVMSRINSHLGGLVTIKKQSASSPDIAVLQALVPNAPVAVLLQRVTQLPQPQQAPFAPWLDAVHGRDAALAELPLLDGAP